MQFYCDTCRCPLQVGQTMCKCGQIFDPVPVWRPDGPSNYWPWAHDTRPAIVQWFSGLPPGIKAAVAGLFALGLAVPTVGGAISHYRTLTAPERAAEARAAASATPTSPPAAPVAGQPVAPAMPAPVVMMRMPEPHDDHFHHSNSASPTYNPAPSSQSLPPDLATPRDAVPSPQSPLQTALTAAAEAEQSGVSPVWRGSENEPKTTDYNSTISNSPALNTMLSAMDQMAQTQGVTSDLVNLRGRFQNILATAYGISVDDLMADGDNYMRLQSSHPGLSM